jgi:hypothetical protein
MNKLTLDENVERLGPVFHSQIKCLKLMKKRREKLLSYDPLEFPIGVFAKRTP